MKSGIIKYTGILFFLLLFISCSGLIERETIYYRISYQDNGANGGSAPEEQSKHQNESIVLASNYGNLVKDGYDFFGWNTQADGNGEDYTEGFVYSKDEDLVLFAKWIPVNYYKINYHGNDSDSGVVPDTQTKIQGEDLIINGNSGNLERNGYNFAEWNTKADGSGTEYSEGSVYSYDADLELFAQWTILPVFNVKYDGNGAESGSVPFSRTKTGGEDLIISGNSGDLKKAAFNFAGWNTKDDGSGIHYTEGSVYSEDKDLLLYAEWTQKPVYIISYNANGATEGSAPPDQSKTSGADIILSKNTGALVREGYIFSGWNTAANGTGTDYAVESVYGIEYGITLYAKWNIETYPVSYELNGADSGTVPETQLKSYMTPLTLATNAGSLHKLSHKFVCWNTAADGSGTDYAEGGTYNSDAQLILYPKWAIDYSFSLSDPVFINTGSTGISLMINGGENGSTYYYSVDDTNGAISPVSGSGMITTSSQLIITSALENLDDGNLTVSISLEDGDVLKKSVQKMTLAGGSGTSGDPYQIATDEQLSSLRYLTGTYYDNTYFILTANIDLSSICGVGGSQYNGGEGWDPIGNNSTTDEASRFYGELDGNGFTISNLYANRPSQLWQALIGGLVNSTISDLNITSVNLTGISRVGALAGFISSTINISNVNTSGNITTNGRSGGLFGQDFGSEATISDCSSSVDISVSYLDSTYTGTYTGGLIGGIFNPIIINRCYATGTITADANVSRVGGLIGCIYDTTDLSVSISNSYAQVNITSGNTYLGGLIGWVADGGGKTFTNCYSSGNQTFFGAAGAGGTYT